MTADPNTSGQTNTEKTRSYAIDEQTGKVFAIDKEGIVDIIAAIISVIYMLLMMAFFFWQIFDIWVRQFSIPNLLGYPNTQLLDSPDFLLPVFAILGGGLGGLVNGIRSFLVWHAERKAFGQRFLWRYITLPWLGAALALFTYALIRGGVAVFSGNAAPTVTNSTDLLTTFGIGVLAGYGAQKVFIWLDVQVERIFKAPKSAVVPELKGGTSENAKKVLELVNLSLGKIQEEDQDDESLEGRVIRQTPTPGSIVDGGSTVNVVLGRSRADGS